MRPLCCFAFTRKGNLIFPGLLTLFVIIATLFGCQPDRNGSPAANSPPRLFFVNTPPDDARFSRNPEISWYATDIDGYIVFFRYAVVLDSLLLLDNEHTGPDEFADYAADLQFGWDTLFVDLDHSRTTAIIRLHANIDFPVDSFVTQYLFVQAMDDRGAMSSIKWRRYSRNNHYPNTYFSSNAHFINAPEANSPAPGINLNWFGVDSLDWGRAEPPLEYEWRLYGPFEDSAIIYVDLVREDCVYDPIGDSFRDCRTVPVLNLEKLPQAVNNLPQPLEHSRGPNYTNDPDDVWVTETQTTIYNVYRDLDIQKTSGYKFVFWVRTRDDGFVPDPTPPFDQFRVYEAKFEHSVMVVDETRYDSRNGKWAPRDIDTAKACFYNFIRGAGYEDFDTLYDSTRTATMHYFYATNRRNTVGTIFPNTNAQPTLTDVLSHRVIIYYNDDTEGGPDESSDGLLHMVFIGQDMGASAWMLSRNLGDSRWIDERGATFPKSLEFQQKFGIAVATCEGWLRPLFLDYPNGEFTEEYVGAYANLEGYPQVRLDYGPGGLLSARYPPTSFDANYVLTGLPEVGIGLRTAYARPLYLYLSKYGEESFFHGKVNSVIQQVGDMRSACFMFTPTAMDPEAMQTVFALLLEWLSAKFGELPVASLKTVTHGEPAFADITERRSRIALFLDFLDEYAAEGQGTIMVLPERLSYEITPGSQIRIVP